MTEPVDQLEQVAQELLNEAEKETDPVKRELSCIWPRNIVAARNRREEAWWSSPPEIQL
jgi:hypothetical protein